MALTPEQREVLDSLGDFTEDQFLQPQYAAPLLVALRELREQGAPITQDDAAGWARQREWTERKAGMLAGIVWAVRYG